MKNRRNRLKSVFGTINFKRSLKGEIKLLFTSFILICIVNNTYSQTVSIDRNFGENGTVTIPNGGVEFIDFDRQGNIIALGYSVSSCPTIIKTDANGIIDTNFGDNGIVILDEYNSNRGARLGIKVTNENKIVIVFLVSWHTFVGPDDPPKRIIMRFNEDGTIDENFGNSGEIILEQSFCRKYRK